MNRTKEKQKENIKEKKKKHRPKIHFFLPLFSYTSLTIHFFLFSKDYLNTSPVIAKRLDDFNPSSQSWKFEVRKDSLVIHRNKRLGGGHHGK